MNNLDLKSGDKVKIKEDLSVGSQYGSVYVTGDMISFAERQNYYGEIDKIIPGMGYSLKNQKIQRRTWSAQMFEEKIETLELYPKDLLKAYMNAPFETKRTLRDLYPKFDFGNVSEIDKEYTVGNIVLVYKTYDSGKTSFFGAYIICVVNEYNYALININSGGRLTEAVRVEKGKKRILRELLTGVHYLNTYSFKLIKNNVRYE